MPLEMRIGRSGQQNRRVDNTCLSLCFSLGWSSVCKCKYYYYYYSTSSSTAIATATATVAATVAAPTAAQTAS